MSAGIKLGWAFFGLLITLLLGYGLTRGIFVGAINQVHPKTDTINAYYSYECRYLYPDGIRMKWSGATGPTPEEASGEGYCPLLAVEP